MFYVCSHGPKSYTGSMTGNGKSRLYKVYICEKNVLQLCRLLDLVLGVALHLNRYLFISSYKASETPDYLFSKG